MDLFSFTPSPLILTFSLTLFLLSRGVLGATFTFVNKCEYTVWPGILANAGSPTLGSTGFELPTDSSRAFQAPTGWSGRCWGRTGCNFDGSASTSCSTADCGSGQVECNGAGAAPPATLAEFTLGTGGQDFYLALAIVLGRWSIHDKGLDVAANRRHTKSLITSPSSVEGF